MWHSKLKDLVTDGSLQLVGIIQEQHAERCRLFAQWHQIDWPILHDPINSAGVRAVPIFVAIDADGVVRNTRPTPEWVRDTLMKKHAISPAGVVPVAAQKPDLSTLKARKANPGSRPLTSTEMIALSDLSYLWDRDEDFSPIYDQVRGDAGRSAALLFRRGVTALRLRDSVRGERRQGEDLATAIAHLEQALDVDPNHYIYRRRIQQYGPRLKKPYPFYNWVAEAQAAIRARGEFPIELRVPLTGSEIADPRDTSPRANLSNAIEPDPRARIQEDEGELVSISVACVPTHPKAGETFRLHVSLRPNPSVAHWTNETPPALAWLTLPAGWNAPGQRLEFPQNSSLSESAERRSVDVEITASETIESGATIAGYALYYICEERRGQCLYLRQSFDIPLTSRD